MANLEEAINICAPTLFLYNHMFIYVPRGILACYHELTNYLCNYFGSVFFFVFVFCTIFMS